MAARSLVHNQQVLGAAWRRAPTNLALGMPADGDANDTWTKHKLRILCFCVRSTCWSNGVASSRKHVRLTFDVHFGSLEDKGGSSEGFRVFESTSCRQDPRLLTSMAWCVWCLTQWRDWHLNLQPLALGCPWSQLYLHHAFQRYV